MVLILDQSRGWPATDAAKESLGGTKSKCRYRRYEQRMTKYPYYYLLPSTAIVMLAEGGGWRTLMLMRAVGGGTTPTTRTNFRRADRQAGN